MRGTLTCDPGLPIARIFYCVQHLLKDVSLFEGEARQSGLDTRVQQAQCDIIKAAIEMGFGVSDYSAVFAAVVPDEEQRQGVQEQADP